MEFVRILVYQDVDGFDLITGLHSVSEQSPSSFVFPCHRSFFIRLSQFWKNNNCVQIGDSYFVLSVLHFT
jgi:hypothetical protein